MTDEASTSGPFDLERLKELVALMEQHGLTEVNLRRGDEVWRLRRGPNQAETPMVPLPFAAAQAPPPATQASPAETAAEKPAPEEKLLEIKSPTIGTFYSAPSPEEPAFVEIGSRVTPETTVCIVEAMKVFNQIPAEISGTITEVLVANGDPVEFGQPLFRVRPD